MPETGTLRSRIASGRQAELDAEIERIEKRGATPTGHVPEWRRRRMMKEDGSRREPWEAVADLTGDVPL